MKKRCFSLVELVVVVVLLAVVAVIVLLMLNSAARRREALLTTCMFGNLKQLSTALSIYGDDNRSYLPDGDNAKGLAALMRFGYVQDGALFVCPATLNTPAPTWQELYAEKDSGNPRKDASLHCSYLYSGGVYMNDLTPQNVILRDKAGNHKVQPVIMGDFSVKKENVD